MFKNLKNLMVGIFSAVIVIAVGASAYTALASPGVDEPAAEVATENLGKGNGGNGSGTSLLDLPAGELSAEEAASLLYMREEEKLARDVYNALYAAWGQTTFTNIAVSEQAHMDEIKLLLDRYALADPALEPASFSDPGLAALYDRLLAQGSLSLPDALKIGAAIEEIDILDLQERLAQTDNADIQQVYNNLMMGSYNHLNAFVGALQAQSGETYQPQYLSAEAYAAIVTGQRGNGNQGGQGAGMQQGNGGQSGQGQGNAANGLAISGATTLTGSVTAYDTLTLTVLTTDGQTLAVQLGNARFASSIGFNPQIGQNVAVYGFPGDQGLFSAITVTLDGQVYAFRDEMGRPLWAGGHGRGNGGQH
ncbi:MAG: hypothetical protein Fur0043_28410 [Anaerolineales bacterium]